MFDILTTIYYILGFYFVIYEIRNLLNPEKYLAQSLIIKTIGVELKDGTDEERKLKIRMWYAMMKPQLRYFLYCVIGLFTAQWTYFLALHLLGYIQSKFKDSPNLSVQREVIRADAIVSLLLLLVIEYNHFM